MENDDMGPVEDFDWGKPGSRPFGLTERQFKFVLARLEGKTRTAAAEEAGYSGEGNVLRSTGSQVAKARSVKAAIDAYRTWQGQSDRVEGSPEELRGLLWQSVRNPVTTNERVSAARLLKELDAIEAAREKQITAEEVVEGLGEILDRRNMECLLASLGMHPKGLHLVDVKAKHGS